MKFAVIARPPVVGGKLTWFDATEALKVPGVGEGGGGAGLSLAVQVHAGGGIAVVARNTGCAIHGPRQAESGLGQRTQPRTTIPQRSRKTMEQTAASPCKVVRNDGDAEGALKSAARVGHGAVLRSASGTCQHGAAERGRACLRGWSV